MLFALSAQAEQVLERDFARHAVQRKYLAIVAGEVLQPRTIESWLIRDRGDGKRGSSPLGKRSESAGGQRALTRVTPVQPLPAHTLVECELETGRTHQIRIHLSELGHPLAGDKVYTAPAGTELPASPIPPPPRHALHSHHLRFTHPTTGETMEFSSPWPPDIAGWLKRLRAAGD
jgi:23S rRNA pseudouridine1911/1915/1917 synthase